MEKKIEFVCSLQRHSRVEYYFIILPKEVVVKKSEYLSDWLQVNKDVHVTLSPACPERSSPEPDYKGMIDTLIYLREHCGNRFRPKIQPILEFISGLFADQLQTKHTPQGDQTGVKKEET